MKLLIKKIVTILPDKLALQIPYFYHHRQFINWKTPRTFCEKLQWLKVYDRTPSYTDLVDKIKVKPIVSEIIGAEYIIPTIKIWDSPADINFHELPDQFVLKTNHAGGSSGVVVCKDKSKLDKCKCIQSLEHSFTSDTYYYGREWPYKNIQRKVFAEAFLSDENGRELTDYKFFCFNGEPKLCQVISERSTDEQIDFYDMEWNRINGLVGLSANVHNSINGHKKPLTFDNMKEIASKLSQRLKFARVDLYEVNGKCYFGEITLYPASGFGKFRPEEWNIEIGSWLNLNI